jgi:hypothetical protein
MNYDPNSNNLIKKNGQVTQEELGKKKVDKVISGNVRTQKKTKATKLADIFIADDMNSVTKYIFSEVLVPSLKKTLADAVKTGVDKLLYGDSSADMSAPKVPATRISYNGYYGGNQPVKSNTMLPNEETYDYNNIILASRGDAEAVLMGMDDIIAKYEIVSVADLYDLVGITGKYTDYKYGWSDIRSARIERVRDGYRIKMPKALPLD